jgi:hypothetical protein
MVWADAAGVPAEPLDRVLLVVKDAEQEGIIVVAPDQWVAAPVETNAIIKAVERREPKDDGSLPGADMPGLGTHLRSEEVEGVVTAIDPVARTVTMTSDGGGSQTVNFM